MKYSGSGFLVTVVGQNDLPYGFFAPDGSTRVTQDQGLGLYAPNGSIRIGSSGNSVYTPRGALNGTLAGRVFTPINMGGGYPWLLNAKRSQFSTYWLPALTAVKAGTRNAKIAFVGDSTMRGQTQGGGTTQIPNAVPAKAAAALQTMGFAAGAQNAFGVGLGPPLDNYDSRFVTTGLPLATTGQDPPGGQAWRLTKTGDKLSFTPSTPCDTGDFYWTYATASGNAFTLDIDGGTATPVTANGSATTINKTTLTTALGMHTFNAAWVSGDVRIVGFDCYNSSVKQISCWNFGLGGSSSGTWTNATTSWSRLRGVMEGYAPDLVILSLGINDWRTSVSVATYTSQMQTLIDQVRSTYANKADLILETSVWDGGSTGNAANQAQYMQAVRDLAIANDLPVIDTAFVWQSYVVSNMLGRYSDTVHNAIVGHTERGGRSAQAVTLFAPTP